MDTEIANLLTQRIKKSQLINWANSQPDSFPSIIAIAISNHLPECWRACWLLNHLIDENDERVRTHISNLIKAVPGKTEGHQRELIKVLAKMELDDEQEGKLFDICTTLWKSVRKIPSLRMIAFRFMHELMTKYPDLKSELSYLVQPEYLESLSPGIRKSIKRSFQSELRLTLCPEKCSDILLPTK